MTSTISIPDTHLDLFDASPVAGFTTIGPSGYPQTSAIWFVLDRTGDGDVIRTSVVPARQRYRNLLQLPKASLFLIDPANPFRTIDVRGDVSFEPDPDLAFFDRLLERYGQTRESFQGPLDDRITLTLHPRRVRA